MFNPSGLANDLGLRRETVEHYVAVLERLFLVRRLPARGRNPANRLVASPKVHFWTVVWPTWGIEVKVGATVGPRDGQGLRRIADRCGEDFESGVLLYAGRDVLPLGDRRMLAVPLSELWEW